MPTRPTLAQDRFLRFIQDPPGTVEAGETFAARVAVLDDEGDPDDDFSPNVQLVLVDGAPELLAGTTSKKVDSNGEVRFDDLSVSSGGSYRLRVTGGSAVPDTSSAFLVSSAAATALEFEQPPTDTEAGAAISPAVTVRAVLGPGVTDPTFTGDVTIAFGTNAGNGALSGTTTVAAVAGVATFSTLSIDSTGSGYTLTASATGLTGATSASFDVTPGPASGATSTIAALPTSIPADGGSTSTITVELRDASGNPLATSGGTVLLSTTAGSLGAVSDPGDGTYTATLTASSVAETATVSGTVNGGAITDTATVTFTAVGPGPPSGATSQITASPTSIPADGASTSTITVALRDASGDPLATGDDTVTLSTTAGSLGAVTDQGDGTYTATLTASSAAETATVSGTVNGGAISDTATVTFTAVQPPATRLVFDEQPTSTQAGATISPPVTVRAVDNSFATVSSFTGQVTIAIGANPGGGTLSGTTTVSAVSGVATFSDLSINRTGSGYTLAASASGLTGATSAPFAITPGPASGATSTITALPTSIPANGTSTSTITVELRDALGNRRTTGSVTVTLSTTAGSLSSVTDQGDGTYTATLTSTTTSETATISGTVGGAAISDTATVQFTTVAPVATRLEFGQQPGSTQAGTAISPAVTVRAVDSGGATVTSFTGNVTVAIGANPGGGTLSGTATVAAVSGVATFSNLSINRTGSGYTLTASASGLTGATSAPFAITPGPPSSATSTITALPTSIPSNGTSTSTITVELRDALGNRRTTGGATVTLSTTGGSLGSVTDRGDGTFTATLTAPSSTATTTATVSGTVGGATISDTATVTFTGVAPVATRVVFEQQPSNVQAGASISPAITVRAIDSGGSTVTSFTGNVTIAIATNPGSGTLSGTATVAAVSGVATFSNLSINRPGIGYTLSAAASGLTGATSAAFAVTPGPPSAATSTITALPTSVPADGASSSTITVELRDAQGNRRTTGGAVVTLTTTAGSLGPVTDRGDGTYTAELTAPAAPATATVRGTVGGAAITDTATVTFTFVPPTSVRLVFGQQPTTTQAGAAISPAVTVRAVDSGGATVSSFTGNVTITIGVNPAGGTLSGTTTVAAVAGVATFGNLSIERVGIGYRLAASASGLTGATSTPFTIIPGPASAARTTITAVPTTVVADGASTSTITVDVRDAFNNRRDAGGDPVTLSTTAGTLGPVADQRNGLYTATLTAPASAAVATITGTVRGTVINDSATVTFTSGTPAASLLVFGQQPGSTQPGAAISPPVTVRAVTSTGATVTTFTGNVTVVLGANPGGGTLSGTTTVAAVAGVATFGNLSINQPGTGYTLLASASGLTGAASTPFSVAAAGGSTDLAVTASVDDSEPAIGETVTYTIRVTNQGSERATGVEVTYELSERLAFVSSVPGKGSYSPQLGVWSVGVLQPGEGATLEIMAQVLR